MGTGDGLAGSCPPRTRRVGKIRRGLLCAPGTSAAAKLCGLNSAWAQPLPCLRDMSGVGLFVHLGGSAMWLALCLYALACQGEPPCLWPQGPGGPV